MAAVSAPTGALVDAGNACKRLQKELMALMMSKDEGISAFPDADNILTWTATIDGKPAALWRKQVNTLTILLMRLMADAEICRLLWNCL